MHIRFPLKQFQITGYIYNGWQFLIIENNNFMFFISSLALIGHSNNDLANSFIVFILFYFYFLKDFIYFIFTQRGREGEKEGEKHQCVVASHVPHTGDLACNPGMCSEWELNQRPFGLQAGTQSTDPHQPGLTFHNFKIVIMFLPYLPNWRCGKIR